MRRIIKRILTVLFFISVIPTAGALLSQYISPAAVWPFAFLGLLFPLLMLIQVVLFFLLLIFRSRAVLLPALMILAAWTPLVHTFQLPSPGENKKTHEGDIRIMSFNVRLLDYFQWSGKKNTAEEIFRHIREENPDILCLQEFLIQDPGKMPLKKVQEELAFLPYSHIEYNYTMQNRKHGLAIFSRYPLVSTGHEHFEGSRNMVIHADIQVGKRTVRVYNNHLESIHFDRDEFEAIDNKSDEKPITRDKISEIVARMRAAYVKRAGQALVMKSKIAESPYPVVVCGDFNDTPVSFATRKIRADLYDSFRSGGKGLGITFPNMKAPLRIDYILHGKELVSSGFETGKIRYSDHRPVSCYLTLD